MNIVYLKNHGTEFINANKDIIIINPSIIKLPKKQLNNTKMTLYNESGHNVMIDVNSKTDLIYSQTYAPMGLSQVVVEPNRKFELVYINHIYNKVGRWYLSIF
jgi:GTP:adenosylcobinamide-phosphate guanylyltransferase